MDRKECDCMQCGSPEQNRMEVHSRQPSDWRRHLIGIGYLKNTGFSRVKKEKNVVKSLKVENCRNCSPSDLWASSTEAAYSEHSIAIHSILMAGYVKTVRYGLLSDIISSIRHYQTLSVVDDYVYLGVTFNYNNKFRKAQTKQLNQARRAMYSLLSKSYSLDLPIDILLELFDQLVIPVLLYGSEVWGFEVIRNLEVFHMKFCKQILKLNRSTANCMVLGELGRFSLEKYISNRMINFWCNLEHSGQNKLSGKENKNSPRHARNVWFMVYMRKHKQYLD